MSLKGSHKNKLQFILNNNNKFNINFTKENIQNDYRIPQTNGNISANQTSLLNYENMQNKNEDKYKRQSPQDDINKNININEVINQAEKDRKEKIQSSIIEDNHEISNSCINDCITWTLKANINKGKNTIKSFISNYIFEGKNIFFPKLDFGILNALNNPLCLEKCFPTNKIKIDGKKKILDKLYRESVRQIKEIDLNKNESNNENIFFDNASLKNILENNYPIDNNKNNNFNIIDNNLCLKENLNNVFLIKFDLKNDISNNDDFRLINDNCVDRDIDFVLNGEFHGKKIFKNDLTFSVSYRDFIKTIQFRLENFKSKVMDYIHNKKYGESSNRNHNSIIQIKNQKVFYGKLINNVNIGIEFLKPQSFDKLQTNFNSIVNSEIELLKIFFELTIPKKLVKNISENNAEKNEKNNILELRKNESLIAPKKDEEKNKNINTVIKEPILYIPPPPPLFIPKPLFNPSSSNIPPPPPPPASWAKLNFFNMRFDEKGVPLPPPFPNFNNILYKKDDNKKFPNVTFDYLSINNNDQRSPSLSVDPRNIYSSPGSGNFSPLSASFMMIQPMSYYGGLISHQSMSMNSPFNISSCSSPYINDNLKFPHLSLNSRKYSDNFSNELFDNLMVSNNKLYNSSQKTPNIRKKHGEEPISFLNLQESISQQSLEKQQNSLNETDISSNDHQKKMKPMTIIKRIELDKKKKEAKNKKIEKKETETNNKNLSRELRDSFVMANQGKTNLEIFMESVSPLYKNNIDCPFIKLKLMDIFNKFKVISLLGLKNVYCFNGELIYLSYILSLSSISIKITNKALMKEIVLELKKKYEVLEKYCQLKEGEELVINIMQYMIYFSKEYIQISFSENKPYQFRKSFITIINELSNIFPYFDKIAIEDINLLDSLFSILYYPLKCSKPYINYTSFVVYYQFTKEAIQDKITKKYSNYDKQTIIGVLPIKINTNLYFQRIIIYNFVMNLSPLFNYFSPYFNNDTITIKNMIYSVINDISKHMRSKSYDYESFMKLSKHNSINHFKIN